MLNLQVKGFLLVEEVRDQQRSVARDALVSGTEDPTTMRPPWDSLLKGVIVDKRLYTKAG